MFQGWRFASQKGLADRALTRSTRWPRPLTRRHDLWMSVRIMALVFSGGVPCEGMEGMGGGGRWRVEGFGGGKGRWCVGCWVVGGGCVDGCLRGCLTSLARSRSRGKERVPSTITDERDPGRRASCGMHDALPFDTRRLQSEPAVASSCLRDS